MDAVNEKTTRYLKASFKRANGTLQQPTSISYRVDCVTSGQNVRPWTAVTPAPTVEIELSADDNTLRNREHARERRVVTIVATYGPGPSDQVVAEDEYEVRRLRFFDL